MIFFSTKGKHMKKLILLAITSVFTFAVNVIANDKVNDPQMQEMMKKYEAAATPGSSHKMLAEKAGTWNYVSKMWDDPKAKPHESKGTTTFSMILGGRWLQQNFTGQAMGQTFEGMGFVGYDNIKQKYQSIWLDTMSTGAMQGEGTFDDKKKVLKETGTASCPMSADKMQEFRNEWQMVSKDKMVFSMFGKGPMKGPEFKMMEITYTR